VIIMSSALAAVFIIPVTMSSMASLGVVFLVLTSSLEQSSTLGGIAHHGLQGGLLLLLDSQHGIIAHLHGNVLLVVRDLQSRWSDSRSLLHGLCCIPLDKSIQPSLSEQVWFHLFSSSFLAIGGTAIHPVYSVNTLPAASGLLHLL
jgi:hypothetical protein